MRDDAFTNPTSVATCCTSHESIIMEKKSSAHRYAAESLLKTLLLLPSEQNTDVGAVSYNPMCKTYELYPPIQFADTKHRNWSGHNAEY